MGAGTVRDEGYRAVDLEPWQTSLRAAEGLAPFPTLVVITGSPRLDPAFADPPSRARAGDRGDHRGHDERPYGRSAAPGARCSAPGRRVDRAAWVVAELAGGGLTRVLCEGGPACTAT